MSIVTKTGDKGSTGLMYNRRVPKNHPRIDACGAVDELNAALGFARATAQSDFIQNIVLPIQKNLVFLMGELATGKEDWEKYQKDGYTLIKSDSTAQLDKLVIELEAKQPPIRDWVMPGGNVAGASFDIARTTCRRAERLVCALQEAGELLNPEVVIYLNRLADLLWLLARWAETNVKA